MHHAVAVALVLAGPKRDYRATVAAEAGQPRRGRHPGSQVHAQPDVLPGGVRTTLGPPGPPEAVA